MNNYFCGWYFKCQNKEQTLALIPAVHSFNGKRSASLQLISNDGYWQIPLSYRRMQVDKRRPIALYEPGYFSPGGISLHLTTPRLAISGELFFADFTPLKYDIMGPFHFVPFMECRHNIFSMRHKVNGEMHINNTSYQFNNSLGYIEGDRGHSFPKHYLWSHCFFADGSVMLSVAHIPLGPIQFTGIIAVVMLGGKEYRLATYLGAKVVSLQNREVVIRQGDLTLTVALLKGAPFPLRAPILGQMSRTIQESTACVAYYHLAKGKKTLLEFQSARASFEYEYPS